MHLEAQKLKVYIRDRLLLDIDHLQIHAHDRIGLVGRNGSGKTTLMKILAGKQKPDEGFIHRPATCDLLPQLKSSPLNKSGGEITQAFIQESLHKAPGILFADEPTTNLDT